MSSPRKLPASTAPNRDLLQEYRQDGSSAEFAFEPTNLGRPAWRKVAMAFGLLLFGVVLTFAGVGMWVSGSQNVLPMLIIGSLVLCPGLYFSVIAFLAWRGQRGFTFDMIPDV